MRIVSESIYRNIFEAMVFVSILSLFEFAFFYGIVVPQNEKKINKNIQESITKMEFGDEPESKEKLADGKLINVIANMINQDINQKITNKPLQKEGLKYMIEKRLDSYRVVFELFDKEFEEENLKKFYLTIIIVLGCFILTILWFIYGYYFYGYTILKESMLISLPITFIFVATGQLFLTLYIIPQFMLGNDSNVESKVYQLLRKYQKEFKTINSYLGIVPELAGESGSTRTTN